MSMNAPGDGRDLPDYEQRLRSEVHRLQMVVAKQIDQLATLEKELRRRNSIIDGVCGALADAGGDILCQREDGNYGESVRQVVKERDEANRHWIEDDRDLNELIAENEKLTARIAELESQLAEMPKVIVGSLTTYLPVGFYAVAAADGYFFDHQIVVSDDIDSGATTVGWLYCRLDFPATSAATNQKGGAT